MTSDIGQPLRPESVPDQAFLRVANDLRKLVGALHPGSPIPREEELRALFGVSRSTMREACAVLVGAGLIESRRGLGMFVVGQPPDPGQPVADVVPASVLRPEKQTELEGIAERLGVPLWTVIELGAELALETRLVGGLESWARRQVEKRNLTEDNDG